MAASEAKALAAAMEGLAAKHAERQRAVEEEHGSREAFERAKEEAEALEAAAKAVGELMMRDVRLREKGEAGRKS